MSEDEAVSIERRPAGQVFGLLSSPLRVDIIQELGETGEPLSFSALLGAVGERDSGKFNYHLQNLLGHFVTKGEDGYRLSFAGEQVYGAILSGAYTANASIAPFEFEGPCPVCGAEHLVAAYTDETAALSCSACDEWRNEFPFPPGSLDQFDRRELPYAFDRWMRATVMRFLQGFCGNCGGRVDATLERSPPGATRDAMTRFACGRCGDELRASPVLPVLYRPTTISFFEGHGTDVLSDPSWRYYGTDDDVTVDVTNEDPMRVEVRITVDGTELVASITDEVAIDEIAVRT